MKTIKRKGFTLVELLVVIAILAILATVSVVGYTSFIESANVSVDENLAAQLNNFLDAYQVNNREEVTPDNVWKVTNDLLELGGLDELQTKTDKYNFYFKFTKDANGNYVGGDYVVAKDGDIINKSGMRIVWETIAGDDDTLKPGFFKYKDELYFLVNTTGSDLAEAVRGFYTFDHIEGADKFTEFQNIVDKLDTANHANIIAAAKNSVFVTTEGTLVVDGLETATNYVFHTEEGITMGTSVSVTLSDPVTVPSNIVSYEVGAFDVTYTDDGKLVFEASSEELASALCEDTLPNEITVVIDGKTWTYYSATSSSDANITTGSETVTLTIANPLAGFDIEITGTDNTTKYNNKELNVGILVWDGETFQLSLKNLEAADTTKTLSTKRVIWTITDANGETEDADGNAITYAGVSLSDDGVISLTAVNGLYPTTTEFYVTATAAHPHDVDGAEVYANKTFKVILSRPNYAEIKVDGATTSNALDTLKGALTVLYGELNSGSTKNSYGITATVATGKEGHTNFFTGAEYIESPTVTTNSKYVTINGVNVNIDGQIFTDSNEDGTVDSKDTVLTTKDITVTVQVGNYVKYDITLTLYNTKFLFEVANTNLKVLGTEGDTIKVTDLFKMIDGVTLPTGVTASVNVYYDLDGNANIADLKTLGNPISTAVSDKYIYSETKNSIATTDTTSGFNFALPGSTTNGKLCFVVTLTDANGNVVRGSDNYVLNIVKAANVRDWESLKYYSESLNKTTKTTTVTYDSSNSAHKADTSTSTNDDGIITVTTKAISGTNFVTTTDTYTGISVVLLNDVDMAEYTSTEAKPVLTDTTMLYVQSGNTFYGNGYTFDIVGGNSDATGIINLCRGTLNGIRIIGEVYEEIATTMSDNYSASVVYSTGGTIENCYLANCRSNVRHGKGTLNIRDSVFFGGRYANIDFITGTLKMYGTVVTVQQPYNVEGQSTQVIGAGIMCYFQDNLKKISLETENGVAATLKQYNFMSKTETSDMPTIYGVDLSDPFNQLIEGDYANYKYGDSSNPYVNTGIAVIDKYRLDYKPVRSDLAQCDCTNQGADADPDKHTKYGELANGSYGSCNYWQDATDVKTSVNNVGRPVDIIIAPSVTVSDVAVKIDYDTERYYVDLKDYYDIFGISVSDTTLYIDNDADGELDDEDTIVTKTDTRLYIDVANSDDDTMLLVNDTTNGELTLYNQSFIANTNEETHNVTYRFRYNKQRWILGGYNDMQFYVELQSESYLALNTSGLTGYDATEFEYDASAMMESLIAGYFDFHSKDIHSSTVLFDIRTLINTNEANQELFTEYKEMIDSTKGAYQYYAPENYFFTNGSAVGNLYNTNGGKH